MALNSAQSILNLIRINGSDEYKTAVPALSDDDLIGKVGDVILTQPVIFKEFSMLLGALLEIEAIKRAWRNPFADLIKTKARPLGEYTAEVANNPVQPHTYDPLHPERVLNYNMLEDKVAYYVRNVKEIFEVSIAREDMMGAFASYDAFNDYVSMKLAMLESGKEISMFNHILEAIVTNYNGGLFKVSEIEAKPENYGKWLTAAKNAIDGFAFPSTDFNNYGSLEGANGDFVAWTNPEDIYIMCTIEWLNTIDVEYLASVFNLDKAELGKRIVKVPSFSYTAYEYDENDNITGSSVVDSDIACIVCDRRMFKYSTELEQTNEFFNPKTLVTNIFKHMWGTYAISPFANCIVFKKGSDVDTIELSDNNVDMLTEASATLTYTPTDATVEIKSGNIFVYSDEAGTFVLTNVETLGDVLTAEAAEGTITFTYDNTAELPTGITAGDQLLIAYDINGNPVSVSLQLDAGTE